MQRCHPDQVRGFASRIIGRVEGPVFLLVATEQQVPRLRSGIRQADAETALGMTNLQW